MKLTAAILLVSSAIAVAAPNPYRHHQGVPPRVGQPNIVTSVIAVDLSTVASRTKTHHKITRQTITRPTITRPTITPSTITDTLVIPFPGITTVTVTITESFSVQVSTSGAPRAPSSPSSSVPQPFHIPGLITLTIPGLPGLPGLPSLHLPSDIASLPSDLSINSLPLPVIATSISLHIPPTNIPGVFPPNDPVPRTTTATTPPSPAKFEVPTPTKPTATTPISFPDILPAGSGVLQNPTTANNVVPASSSPAAPHAANPNSPTPVSDTASPGDDVPEPLDVYETGP